MLIRNALVSLPRRHGNKVSVNSRKFYFVDRLLSSISFFTKSKTPALRFQLRFVYFKWSLAVCAWNSLPSVKIATHKHFNGFQHNVIGIVSMDLSKAFDTLPHDLITAKFKYYGADDKTTQLILD